MPLSEKEVTDIERLLARIGRNAKAWKFTRWIGIVFGPVMIALAIWLFSITQNDIADGVEKNIARIQAEMSYKLYLLAFVNVFIGIQLTGFSLFNWGKWKKDALLVRLAQACLETNKPGENAS
jgi:hypothetical protein